MHLLLAADDPLLMPEPEEAVAVLVLEEVDELDEEELVEVEEVEPAIDHFWL
jgi:hypothetical protein